MQDRLAYMWERGFAWEVRHHLTTLKLAILLLLSNVVSIFAHTRGHESLSALTEWIANGAIVFFFTLYCYDFKEIELDIVPVERKDEAALSLLVNPS